MDREELIAKYIQGKVTEQELEIIRELIQTDEDFREELAFESGLRRAIKQEERQDLKSFLAELEKGHSSQADSENLQTINHQHKGSNAKKILQFSVLGKAAAVLLIGFGAWWFLNQSPDHNALYNTYYEPYPNIVAPTVRGPESTASITAEAFRLYDNKDFPAAATLFEQLTKREDASYAHFYLAQSLLADGHASEAIEVLEDPNWEVPDNLRTPRNWYLALAHLKIGNTEKSRPLLEQIERANSTKSGEAKRLLDEMK
ncbi:MAG TPA: tetratricopeptide repeat protein [Sphingobacteriaceae bacterium]|nr:tetratricopeptide repeat protein [Sphingobacteriaceae bacterium]